MTAYTTLDEQYIYSYIPVSKSLSKTAHDFSNKHTQFTKHIVVRNVKQLVEVPCIWSTITIGYKLISISLKMVTFEYIVKFIPYFITTTEMTKSLVSFNTIQYIFFNWQFMVATPKSTEL